jgi:hypothetical protein
MKTLKRFSAFICLSLLCVCGVKAQTNTPPSTNLLSGPIVDAIDFLGHGSNWFAVPFGMVSTDTKQWGGGLALGYKLSDFVVPVMRIQGIQDEDKHSFSIWMPSFAVQLQAPLTIMGKFTLTPFAYGAAAIPISGAGDKNGDPVGIIGAGAAVRLSPKFDLVGSVEHWTVFNSDQILFGILVKF